MDAQVSFRRQPTSEKRGAKCLAGAWTIEGCKWLEVSRAPVCVARKGLEKHEQKHEQQQEQQQEHEREREG